MFQSMDCVRTRSGFLLITGLVAVFMTACGGSSSSSGNGNDDDTESDVAADENGNGNDETDGTAVTEVDPTSFSFELVQDINPGDDSDPEEFTVADGMLFFTAEDDAYRNVWVTEGTATTTAITFNHEETFSDPEGLAAFDGEVYYSVGSGTARDLWATSGSGARQLLPEENLRPENITAAGGALYFSGDRFGGSKGREPWISDGSDAGTELLKEVNDQGDSRPFAFVEMDDQVFFSAIDAAHGRELRVTDGTTSGTELVENIRPGDEGSDPGLRNPDNFGVLDGQIFFMANDFSGTGFELWVSDGTGAELWELNDTEQSAPRRFARLGDQLFFIATATGFTNEEDLWVTDGTEAGTERLSDDFINPSGSMVEYNSQLYFAAAEGPGLWRSDGTPAGTELAVTLDDRPTRLTVHDGFLFFVVDVSADGEDEDRQLWVSNGTDSGTHMIAPDIATQDDPLDDQFIDFDMKSFGDSLYLPARYTADGRELWRVTQEE